MLIVEPIPKLLVVCIERLRLSVKHTLLLALLCVMWLPGPLLMCATCPPLIETDWTVLTEASWLDKHRCRSFCSLVARSLRCARGTVAVDYSDDDTH